MPAEVVDELVADEMTMCCAGGLMVEHPASAAYLQSIDGGVDNVMGWGSPARRPASLLACSPNYERLQMRAARCCASARGR